jgi:hypothetical protein
MVMRYIYILWLSYAMGVFRSDIIFIDAEIMHLENLLKTEDSEGVEGSMVSPPNVLKLSFEHNRATYLKVESDIFQRISGVELLGAASGKVDLQITFDGTSNPDFLVFPNGVKWVLKKCSGLGGAVVEWDTFFKNHRDRAAQTVSRVKYCKDDEICLMLEAVGPYEYDLGFENTSSVFADLWFEPPKPASRF